MGAVNDVQSVLKEAVARATRRSRAKAYKMVLEFLAVKLGVDSQVCLRLSEELYRFLSDHLDVIVNDPVWDEPVIVDPLGTLGEELGLIPKQIDPDDLIEYVESLHLPTPNRLPPLVLDRTCGTGRKLIAAYRRFGERAVYAGCELHDWSYRIATLNMYLYKVPARILFTRPDYIDASLGSPDWGWAGQWLLSKQPVLEQRRPAGEEAPEWILL